MNKIACLLVASLVVFQLSAFAYAKPSESASSSEETVNEVVVVVESRVDVDALKAYLAEVVAKVKEFASELDWETKLAEVKAALEERFGEDEVAAAIEVVKAKWAEAKETLAALDWDALLAQLEEADIDVDALKALVEPYVAKAKAFLADLEWDTVLDAIKEKLSSADWESIKEKITSWDWESTVTDIVAKIRDLISA